MLRDSVERMKSYRKQSNLLVREKIQEYENEVAICADIVEEFLEDREFDEHITDNLLYHINKSARIQSELMHMTAQLPKHSKN